MSTEIDLLVAHFPRIFKGGAPEFWSDLPHGWRELATQLFQDLDALLTDGEADLLKVLQIKEKYASLRVYRLLGEEEPVGINIHGLDGITSLVLGPDSPAFLFERIKARVAVAAAQSRTTCKLCGASGATQVGRTSIWTLCKSCSSKRGGTS